MVYNRSRPGPSMEREYMTTGTIFVTNGQKFALAKLFGRFCKTRGERLWILSEYLGRIVDSSSGVLLSEWRKIRDGAYPNWHDNNWEVCEKFANNIRKLNSRYEKEVVRQLTMFEE